MLGTPVLTNIGDDERAMVVVMSGAGGCRPGWAAARPPRSLRRSERRARATGCRRACRVRLERAAEMPRQLERQGGGRAGGSGLTTLPRPLCLCPSLPRSPGGSILVVGGGEEVGSGFARSGAAIPLGMHDPSSALVTLGSTAPLSTHELLDPRPSAPSYCKAAKQG
jgi:hypothetical protein